MRLHVPGDQDGDQDADNERQAPGALHVLLFGEVRARRGGHWLRVPAGNQAKVLALLTLNGGCMNRDTLVERLWPEVQVDAGRHQLRSVLARLRAAAGVEIARRGELVVLREELSCDVEEFLLLATRVVSGVDDQAVRCRLGLQAQRLWLGPPLEAWRYEDWAGRLRSRTFHLRERLWQLLDDVPGHAETGSAEGARGTSRR